MSTDALGRQVPTLVGWKLLLEAIPGLARQFRPVPEGYWHGDLHVAHVDCVCGAETLVPAIHATNCKCGRLFLYAGGEVWAARPTTDVKDSAESADPPAGFPSTRS